MTAVPTMIMMPMHTELGNDMLFFPTWMPSTVGSTLGSCVFLFFLAILYRFTLAFLATNVVRNAYKERLAKSPNNLGKKPEGFPVYEVIRYPAFSFKTDLMSGLLEGFSSFIGYLLMLAVMLQNAWFFTAIILGIIVGETAFGRFKRCGSSPAAFVGGSVGC